MKISTKSLVIPFALMLLLAGCGEVTSDSTIKVPVDTTTKTDAQGRVVFGIKDAAASMDGVTSVKVTVESVQVHNASDAWITVTSGAKTYDLLKLKGEGVQALLADVNLKEGTYEQMRIVISNVVVTDAKGAHQAKLPSGELKVVGKFTVKADAVSTVVFDFIADESLHTTGKAGEYIFTPVLKVESKTGATVNITGTVLTITGGSIHSTTTSGMDVSGEMKVNFKIDREKKLELGTDNKFKILDENDIEEKTGVQVKEAIEDAKKSY